uniref:Uncharacterized protein n=1 Tax=Sciurus vulgaris TaxID=55149 RepID=A0A8D2AJZ1_SCIVU
IMPLKTSWKGEAQSYTFIHQVWITHFSIKEFLHCKGICITFYFRSRVCILSSCFQVFVSFVFFDLKNLIFRCIYCCYYYIYC